MLQNFDDLKQVLDTTKCSRADFAHEISFV